MALTDQRRPDLVRLPGRQPEFLELVDFSARGVADPDDDIGQRRGRQVDDAFAALADHVEAVITARDYAADERRRELHHGVPAHRHDVRLVFPFR